MSNLRNPRIFLGIGHGISEDGVGDPGAVGVNGIKEADLTLAVGLSCRDELKRHGVIVGMSRDKKEKDPIAEEIRECNAFDPHYAIDIHFNSAEGTAGKGFEALVYSKGGASLELGICVEKRMIANGQNSRGCKTRLNSQGKDYFGFIRDVKAPSIIAEMAFVNNPEDIKNFDEPHELEQWGKVLAWGILDMCGIEIKPEDNSNDTKPPVVDNKPEVTPPSNNNSSSNTARNITVHDTTLYYESQQLKGIIHEGKTYVPVRHLCEMLELDVDFRDKEVYITKRK